MYSSRYQEISNSSTLQTSRELLELPNEDSDPLSDVISGLDLDSIVYDFDPNLDIKNFNMPPAEQGMPTALKNDDVSSSILKKQPREMEATTDIRMKSTGQSSVAQSAQEQAGKKHSKQSFDYLWRSALAGGLAGTAAKTIVAPLDRVKILFQASNPQFAKYTGSWFGVVTAMKDIYKADGVRGLYRGHSATILRIFPYAAIKFLAYEQIRSAVIPSRDHETPFRRLISGSLAGITSVFFTYPLEVMRVRLAFETKHDSRSSLSGICKIIYNENAPALRSLNGEPAVLAVPLKVFQAVAPRDGLANFYRGFSATMLGMLPYAGVSFLTHDTAGDVLRSPRVAQYTTLPKPANSPIDKPAPLRSWAELLAGGVAGLVSQSSAYPIEVVRRRMQVGGAVGDGHKLRIGETARMIFREKGFMGFWIGLSIGYVKIIPLSAVSFFVYERGKLALGI
ncbi:mitochondrial carrier protein LEU5 [Calycina marina]|uniref:Mitochondrial thiamine pyrophosphate carrier 1 n=1 Tax=Calycina marina TaxID=1763456 RepID=A0A9P7YWD6_9HELO|nr:mitochondrial carrier protein LEU5 [Calycina marina]